MRYHVIVPVVRATVVAAGLLAIPATRMAAGSALSLATDAWADAVQAAREQRLAAEASRTVTASDWRVTAALPYEDFGEPVAPPPEDALQGKPLPDDGTNWHRRRDYLDGTIIDLPVHPGYAMYLRRTLTADADAAATLALGFDDCIEIWLNGAKVFSKQTRHGCQPDQEHIALVLKRGANALLMKVYNQGGGCGFWVNLTGSEQAVAVLEARMARELWRAFPLQMDWRSQDERALSGRYMAPAAAVRALLSPEDDAAHEPRLIERVLGALDGDEAASLRAALDGLKTAGVPAGDLRWLRLYGRACAVRRERRLSPLRREAPRILFVKRHPVQPSFFGYTEGQSDAQAESHFMPGASLCLLELSASGAAVTNLLTDPTGSIRDLDVSFDGGRILFAWKKSHREDDYHLYELRVSDRSIRALTSGAGVADYEGRYLPDGDIVFSSTRCVQTVDCFWTEVSNLYRCDADGRYMRRLGFDQVHTIYPSMLADGRVLYTRWDYNDRGQVFPQGLFSMNADGTGQTAYYGNNSWFPTTTSHARGIPGRDTAVAVLMGHHTWQAGKLAIIDRARGTEEASGVQLVAPVRETKAVRVDQYGQDEELFRHPWPLNDREFIVAMTPDAAARRNRTPFNLCYIDVDGNREVLASDPDISCDHPIPLAPRAAPRRRPSVVDYREDTATYVLQDVYAGPGLTGIERGTAKRLRVVALEYRTAGVGSNGNRGEAGGALISTPISIGCGCWDVKRILGETPIHEDGSACFVVPARTPVYFQVIDADGCAIQTMRSWSTLMPGESFSCVGCHEAKNATPVPARQIMATTAGVASLEPFYGPARGFSFAREVQPILDRHCIRCHDGQTPPAEGSRRLFSLKATPFEDKAAKRVWSDAYLTLTGASRSDRTYGDSSRELVNWIDSQSRPTMLPPYFKGARKSKLLTMLRDGHGKQTLSREELDKLAAWIDLGVPFCGDYLEANAWTQAELDKYMHYQSKRDRLADEERRSLAALAGLEPAAPAAAPSP